MRHDAKISKGAKTLVVVLVTICIKPHKFPMRVLLNYAILESEAQYTVSFNTFKE